MENINQHPNTFALALFIIIGFTILFGQYLYHKYIEYKEGKMFWRDVDDMMKRHDDNYNKAFKEALDKSTPLILEALKKVKESKKNK